MSIRTLYVEKKKNFDIEAKELREDLINNLRVEGIKEVRVINKYKIFNIEDETLRLVKWNVFGERNLDNIWEEKIELKGYKFFAVELLKGQYDQRADAAEECIELINEGNRKKVVSGKVIAIKGNLTEEAMEKIKKYYINPVDSREVSLEDDKQSYEEEVDAKDTVDIISGFINMNDEEITLLHKELGLAMTINDLKLCKEYFSNEKRNPSITEIKVIDTYWSDHCRHTTFLTSIKSVEFEDKDSNKPIRQAYEKYIKMREFVYEKEREITLMDIACIAAKELRKKGFLQDLDESDEINACTIKAKIETDNGLEEYLILFKNETHNHPTEIEPFGGAATCLGGAIRDPLSGRAYVYQAMRVTGSGDPRTLVGDTIKGKLPQRVITKGAAKGYSSYGNQIGLATGQVSETYHEGFIAKRLEIGAVIGAVPRENVRREVPTKGDYIILLGGRTGRDGCGGATGSSKEHNIESIATCGAEVQKGNAVVERKLQRFFRNPVVSKMIKRCNDFGAGGVSVAIGELADGIEIDLNKVKKKYDGLDGTEIAISESQERMAVVIEAKDYEAFLKEASTENLEATKVAEVTDANRMVMTWKNKRIVDISRDFLNTNGAKSYTDVFVKAPSEKGYFTREKSNAPIKDRVLEMLGSLNVCCQKGLAERFDSTIGRVAVLMPFGGKYQLTPAEGMAGKIPVFRGDCKDATLMTYGYNPYIGEWSPYHGAFYAVVESVAKIVAMGGDYKKVYLTFQEYFEKLGEDKEKWGKPFSALLGALTVQEKLNIAAIGGKDSMSGTFENLTVPPTLVSFAVAIEKIKNVISPEFKNANSKVFMIKTEKNEDNLLDLDKFKSNMDKIKALVDKGEIKSAFAIRHGGIVEALCKMSFGNKIGIKVDEALDIDSMFEDGYGSFIIEVSKEVDIEDAIYIGKTTESSFLELGGERISIDTIIKTWMEPLSKVFPYNDEIQCNKLEKSMDGDKKYSLNILKTKPRVFIPTFPGNNCEWDSAYAFEKAGAETSVKVFRNITKEALKESIEMMKLELQKANILMIPGGFSAGDEPEGSGKFIANVFRNPDIKEEVMNLLYKRDGLILGICNGFQALIKLGLVPYGEIVDIKEDMPTLTFNNIGRHISSVVKTEVVSKVSPWFNECRLGDVHNMVISHGEGKFIASDEVVKTLMENGQIATKYVDGNPNGSAFDIEGITSKDGRILGKMGHSERIGNGLYKNIEGSFEQNLFKSGVSYFTKL